MDKIIFSINRLKFDHLYHEFICGDTTNGTKILLTNRDNKIHYELVFEFFSVINIMRAHDKIYKQFIEFMNKLYYNIVDNSDSTITDTFIYKEIYVDNTKAINSPWREAICELIISIDLKVYDFISIYDQYRKYYDIHRYIDINDINDSTIQNIVDFNRMVDKYLETKDIKIVDDYLYNVALRHYHEEG